MAETTENVQQQEQETQQQDQEVQSVDLPEAQMQQAEGPDQQIDVLLGMDIPVSVVVATTSIPVKKLLRLGPGSVLALDKPVHAPVELYLRDRKFATAEVVVVQGRFAVRIKNVLGLDDETEDEQEASQ